MERFLAFSRLNDNSAVAHNATVTVYRSGTVTLASIYASDNVADPLSNPFTTGFDGLAEFYGANARYDVQFSGGGIHTPWALGDILLQDFTGLFPAGPVGTLLRSTGTAVEWVAGQVVTGWYNVTDPAYGANPATTPHTQYLAIRACLDAAIAACPAGGRVGVILPGSFRVDTALAIQMNDAGSGLALVGPGSLEQVTPGADLLVYGRNLAEVADNMLISNLRLKGGGIAGKALRLNNALGGLFDHVEIYNFAYGIYTEGQNERHSFRDCYLEGFTTSGIYCGVSNGEAVWGGVLDYPVLQKCLFERVRVGGSTGPAVVITAGIIDGVQRTSGINRFERLVLEGNKQNGLEFHFSFMSAISGMSNEDYLDTNGVYYALLITDGSMVSARDLYLGCGAQANDYAAKIRLNGGTLFLSDSTVSGAHVSAVADISVLGTLEATNVIVTDKDAIVFDSGASHDRSLLHNVMDAAGVPITNWDALTAIPNAISPSANGVYVPQLVVNTLIHRVVDSGGQLIELHLPASGSAYNRIVFGSTTASEAGFQFDHAAGIKAIKGDVSGLASFYAAHFYLETPADYTVVSPTTLRTIDVSAATLSDVRQVLGTLIADLQAAGLLT